MSDSLIRINGRAFDAGSVRIKIAGRAFIGIKSTKYDHKRTKAKVDATVPGLGALGYTQGKYEAGDATFSMLRRTAQDMRDMLAARAGNGSYGDTEFPIIIYYVAPGIPACKDELLRCSVMTDGGGHDTGNADPLYEDVVFQVIKIKRNGKTLSTRRK
jgi:hypothetical protein